MLQVFKAVEEKCAELEQLRIIIQATEITYRQKGEIHTADCIKNLETNLAKAIHILSTET
ncbi:MAG: 5-oxoprolinase (ATP-hydrolyzing) [Firmicutes bacterium]|nr:5-oxoprolinase (ATP-hydrolyzing) [Bacillota bacterium]